ncbi:hypothetical protein ACFYNO_01305 [Kitasatospora sp. NPDC006697]|uniref:hypothetical protein n=1 Tax=Kitasatospora sp. NPDC006697 TaxID=3364020 RepID=UPI00369112B1
MIRLRTAAVAALAFSLTGLLAPAPALAAGRPPHTHASTAARTPASDKVNAFFSDYWSAVEDGDPVRAYDVRRQYLTDYLNGKLDEWAAEHGADPVFRSQQVPTDWAVAQGDSGAGHTTVVLTEYFPDESTLQVRYQLRLADLAIDDIEDSPS